MKQKTTKKWNKKRKKWKKVYDDANADYYLDNDVSEIEQ